MIKYLIVLTLATALIACQTKKNVLAETPIQNEEFLKSEFYFDNCDSLKSFVKKIIITNKSDTTLKKNYFRIPHIKSPYEFTKNIFHEKCFIGISTEELDEIFGERATLIRADGKVITTPTGWYPDWYCLKSDRHMLSFDISIRNNIVEIFKVMPGSTDNILRLNPDKK